jgi:hypothetical protein
MMENNKYIKGTRLVHGRLGLFFSCRQVQDTWYLFGASPHLG